MKILLAVDGSPYSDQAVQSVVQRPWPEGTTVRVLSVAPPVGTPAIGELMYAGGELDNLLEQTRRKARRVSSEAAERLRSAGFAANEVTREGDPRSEIVDEAEQWSADLVVLGSHGYTGMKKWLLGSIAQSVVSHAPCSVEVVRVKLPEDQPKS